MILSMLALEDAMLKIGERAPEFTLPDHRGQEVSLTSMLNRGALILWFFSGFSTPLNVSTGRTITQLSDDLQHRGLFIACITPRSLSATQGLRQRLEVPVPLLCDPGKQVARMYDVIGPIGIGVRSTTYLISRGRIILGSVRGGISIKRQVEFIREAPAVLLSAS